MIQDMRSYRRQRLYVYGRVTFLSRFSLIVPFDGATHWATLKPLSTIAPHIMKHIFFQQRSCFTDGNKVNELWLYSSVVAHNCIFRTDFSLC